MGRRKIEIQPITHERNRSVTFLKRKNGLFKKAYELGVLCSVDVAVIIFEERPGHNVKLYQYCSGNIDEIVQKHARYDGEKDIRAPGDFTGNIGSKPDDVAEDDDAEDDELESPLAKGSASIDRAGEIRPRIEPGVKSGPSASNGSDVDMDYLIRRPMAIPDPPMPMATHSSIPISGERLHSATRMSSGSEMQASSGPNKKPRIAPNMDGGRAPQDEMSPMASEYGYRHSVPAPPHSYRGHHSSDQYAPFFPTQSFPPGASFDYPPSRGQYRSMNYPPGRSIPPYSQHPDQHFIRPVHHPYQQHHPAYPPMMASQQHPSDIFTYLDGDPRQHTPGQGFAPIDWPVHAPGRPTHNQGDPNDVSWLDFLSGNPASGGGPMQASSSSSLPPSARDNVSWERDWPSAAVASRPSSRLSSNMSDIAAHTANPHKRSRVKSDASGGFSNEQGKDIEMIPTPSSTKAIKKMADGGGQALEHDGRQADGEE